MGSPQNCFEPNADPPAEQCGREQGINGGCGIMLGTACLHATVCGPFVVLSLGHPYPCSISTCPPPLSWTMPYARSAPLP